MSSGTPDPGGPKKSSIFSGLAPAPAPAPAPRPAPAAAPAPRPAPAPSISPEVITDLKQKIDLLEKNIVLQLEKKFGEQLKVQAPAFSPPPPPPASPAPETTLLFRKIDEMERRLSDFSHSASISASQLKNIEESKISARREIEDLLKAVREQQKYSELDRQMHEQLERAWTRAEELEKKLMEFYSSVLALEAKRREDADRASDKTTAALDALAARLAGLEQKLSSGSPADELRAAQEGFFRRAGEETVRQAAVQETFRAELAAGLEKLSGSSAAGEMRAAQQEFFLRAREEAHRQAAAQEAVRLEMIEGVKESSQAFKGIFENYVRMELELLRNKVTSETEALRREIAASTEDSRRFLREQAAFAAEKTAEFEKIARANTLKAGGVESALEASARLQTLALEEFSRRLGAEMRAMNADFASAVKMENDARFEKFGAKYADALLSVTFVENFRAAVSESLDKFESYGAQLASFLKEIGPDQLEKASGVSGMVIRRQFGAMTAMLETLKTESSRLREIKRVVEEKFGDIFKER